VAEDLELNMADCFAGPVAACPDLAGLYGDKYQLSRDPAAGPGDTDPWVVTLPCRYGVIYPHGPDTLAVEVDGHPKVAARLRRMGLKAQQDGDGEWTFLFDVADFDRVAEVVRPRRRRVLSPEGRAKLVGAGAGTRFGAA
jgi:hypothetical protein